MYARRFKCRRQNASLRLHEAHNLIQDALDRRACIHFHGSYEHKHRQRTLKIMFSRCNNKTGLETPNWDPRLSSASKKDGSLTSVNPCFSFGRNTSSCDSLGSHFSSKLFESGLKPRLISFQEIQRHTHSRRLVRHFSSDGNGRNSKEEKHVPVNNNGKKIKMRERLLLILLEKHESRNMNCLVLDQTIMLVWGNKINRSGFRMRDSFFKPRSGSHPFYPRSQSSEGCFILFKE